MRLPTASRLERAMNCAASTVLPVVEQVGGEYQTQGRVVHAYLENVTNVGQAAAIALVPEEYREVCAAIDLVSLPVGAESYAAEVTFAFDYETGKARELGRGLGRDYRAATATEFVGTADVVGLLPEAVWIADFKPRWSPNVTPAAANYQLKMLALAAARTYGKNEAHVELVHVGPDGAWRDRASLDAYELDTFHRDLVDLVTSIVRLEADPDAAQSTEGSWCRYCPSFTACPAKRALATALARSPGDVVGVPQGGLLTPEAAGIAWQRLKMARQVLDRVEETLEAYAREAPFVTPDGAIVQATERRTETIDGKAAMPVLERLGLLGAAELKVTKTAVTKAAGKARSEEVLEALRKAGAMKTTITNPIQEKRS